MPVFNSLFYDSPAQNNQPSPAILANLGPIVPVEISIPGALAELYTKQGHALPQPKAGLALVDTGASASCVDDEVITQLGVNPIRTAEIHGSAGQHQVNVYPAHLRFPSMPNFEIEFSAAFGVNINAQKVGDQPIIALLGRDLLTHCELTYNGTLGMFTLAF